MFDDTSTRTNPEIAELLGNISGEKIHSELETLAQVGGKKFDGPTDPNDPRETIYATNRIALSEQDVAGREHIRNSMEQAGLEVYETPLADIGVFTSESTDPELAPLVIMSHSDTVEDGDTYDGVTGVYAGIEIARNMHESGFQNKRPLMVMSLTGEESARFASALFGSRGVFFGLNENDYSLPGRLDDKRKLGEVLGPNTNETDKPIFGESGQFKAPFAVLEMHVQQSEGLSDSGISTGIVKSIAAPMRHMVQVKGVDPEEVSSDIQLALQVKGKANHSGATRMEPQYRADGLVLSADIINEIMADEELAKYLIIKDVDVAGGNMNKIPGKTNSTLAIRSDAPDKSLIIDRLNEIVGLKNKETNESDNDFEENPASVEILNDDIKFNPTDAHVTALRFTKDVQSLGETHARDNVVATVGKYTLNGSNVELLLDVRGFDSRREVLLDELYKLEEANAGRISFSEPIYGSGDPAVMDVGLIRLAQELTAKYELPSTVVIDSGPGHDAMNAARAGFPTLLMFSKSRNGAHKPDAFTTPKEIEETARLLCAMAAEISLDTER